MSMDAHIRDKVIFIQAVHRLSQLLLVTDRWQADLGEPEIAEAHVDVAATM